MDKNLLDLAKKAFRSNIKQAGAEAFVPMPGGAPPADPAMGGDPSMGGAPPMDPAMMGGMPPGMPMDPAMMGGAPPMDPAMMGGMPMDPAMMGGAPPMDPAMMGGMPPAPPAGGLPMDPVQLVSTVIAPIVRDAVRSALAEAAVDIKKKKTDGGAPGAAAAPAAPAAPGGMPPIDPAMLMGAVDPAAAIGGVPSDAMAGLTGAPIDPAMLGAGSPALAGPKMAMTKQASDRSKMEQAISNLRNLTK